MSHKPKIERIKRVEVSVYGPDQKLMRRFRLAPPPAHIPGRTIDNEKACMPEDFKVRQYFTPDGAEAALYKLIGHLDDSNPGNQWRLVRIGYWQFKLVWEDRAELDANKSEELGIDHEFAEVDQ